MGSGGDPIRLNARTVLLASWLVLAAGVVFSAAGRMGVAGDRIGVGPAVVSTAVFAGAAVLFGRLQLQLVQERADPRRAWELLALGFAPLAWGSTGEPVALGFAAVLVCLPATQALPALAATVGGFVLLFPEDGGVTDVTAAAAAVQLVVIGTVFAVITQLAATLDRLQRAREQLHRHRVEVERERVARDLHDLMGRTLVTASLRCETLLRAVPDDQAELREQLSRVQHALGHGQERVRALTSGPTIGGWADEVESSRALCGRLGIDFSLLEEDDIAATSAPLAALALRESTSVAVADPGTSRLEVRLRRTRAQTDVITVTLEGHDPGPGAPAVPDRLAGAVERSGGTVATASGEGTWGIEVRLPAAAP